MQRFWAFVDHNAELRPLPPSHAERGQKNNRPFYPGIAPEPWHDTRHYSDLLAWLRDEFESLREELLALPREEYRDTRDAGWSILNLRALGKPSALFEKYDGRLPRTAALVEHLQRKGVMPPESLGLLRQAPRTGLEPHTDCLNMIACCHVGLTVPRGEEQPWIECAGERREWHEGECMIFDQTFEHTTFNPTGEDRIVLAIDLWHYDLSPVERQALEAFFDFVDQWNESFDVAPFAGMHLPYGAYSIEDLACCI